jgi:hypothetical protein
LHFDTHAQGARIQHTVGQTIPLGAQHHESTLIVQSHVTHRHGVDGWSECNGGDSVGGCSANELGGVGNSCVWYVERVTHRHSKRNNASQPMAAMLRAIDPTLTGLSTLSANTPNRNRCRRSSALHGSGRLNNEITSSGTPKPVTFRRSSSVA